VSSPGHFMYHLWAIRHLPESRYEGFDINPAYEWTLEKQVRF
jgi:hypothetical protein